MNSNAIFCNQFCIFNHILLLQNFTNSHNSALTTLCANFADGILIICFLILPIKYANGVFSFAINYKIVYEDS